MDGFKYFFTEMTEYEKDVKETLKKVPKSHAALIKNYKFKWEPGNTLKGDKNHVGEINPHTKRIRISAPWRYGREYTLLHELAHSVWAAFITPELKKEWSQIVKKNPNRDKKENDEECYAMAYACYYASNKITKHHCDEWMQFIKRFPK